MVVVPIPLFLILEFFTIPDNRYFLWSFWIGFVLLTFLLIRGGVDSENRQKKRLAALEHASQYLKPYTNIWNELILQNEFCKISLLNGQISVTDLITKATFSFDEYDLLVGNDYLSLWDFFCMNFSGETTFDAIIQSCKMMELPYEIKISRLPKIEKIETPNPIVENKIDINNASLEEIKSLPFINTALAKRIIKKREEIGGFKTVEAVCLYLKFNVEKSIKFREYICVKPIIISPADIKNDERSVDW